MFGLTQTVNDYRETIRRLPLVLNLAWLVMHIGLGIAIFGFWKRSGTLGLVGAGLLLLGIVISILDCGIRKGDRKMTAYFSCAMFISALAGLAGATIFGTLLLAVAGITALLGWFSWNALWNTFHFIGLLLTALFVTGLANTIKRRWSQSLMEDDEE